MKTYQDFANETYEQYNESAEMLKKEIQEAANASRSFESVVAVAITASVRHTNRLFGMYHEWLTAQLEKDHPQQP